MFHSGSTVTRTRTECIRHSTEEVNRETETDRFDRFVQQVTCNVPGEGENPPNPSRGSVRNVER